MDSMALAAVMVLFALGVGALAAWTRHAVWTADARTQIASRERDVYELLARQAVHALEIAADQRRAALGTPEPPAVAPVLPEHHSKVTQEQQDTADLATLRARFVAASQVLGLPPEQLSYERNVRRRDA